MAKIRLRIIDSLAQQQGVAAPLPGIGRQLSFAGTTLTGTGTTSITGLSTKGKYMEVFAASTDVLFKHGTGITGTGNADGVVPAGCSVVSGAYTGQATISFKLDS